MYWNNDGKATFKLKFAKYIKKGDLDAQIPDIFGLLKKMITSMS